MSLDLSNLSSRLLDRNTALNIVNEVLKGMLFPYPPENISMEMCACVVATHAEDSIDTIFKYATSPLEKVFLSSILLYGLTEGVFFLSMAPSLHSATEKIQTMTNNYKQIMEAWDSYQEQTGEKSMNAYMDFISKASIPEDLKDLIEHNMYLKIYDIYNTYFFSIKSSFKETFHEKPIETDIFVWTISNPQFRLLVECDEQNYYVDKSSFSEDRARDRFLQSKGLQVLRFSGQEIVSDPLGKAQELIDYLEKRRDKKTRISSKAEDILSFIQNNRLFLS